MAMTIRRRQNPASRPSGFSLVEMLIAMIVLAVCTTASMSLIVLAISNNGRNKQQSNSVAMAQTITERIMAVPAIGTPVLTVTDCANNVFNVATAPGGAPLTAAGDADFTQAQVAQYSMNYTDCDTNGRQAVYDVRWNITTPSNYTKLVVVSARLQNAGQSAVVYSQPVTIKTLVGVGT